MSDSNAFHDLVIFIIKTKEGGSDQLFVRGLGSEKEFREEFCSKGPCEKGDDRPKEI
jgi:hypothetical protein